MASELRHGSPHQLIRIVFALHHTSREKLPASREHSDGRLPFARGDHIVIVRLEAVPVYACL